MSMGDEAAAPGLTWGLERQRELSPPPAPPDPRAPSPKRRGLWPTLVSAGALVLTKLKFLLIGLKALSFGKFALTALSMATMVWFEARRSGWLFGVGFVLLLLLHELGHGFAIRRAGLRSSWPVFIPFFGALISLKEPLKTVQQEAEIAYGGPLAGAAASAALVPIYFATGARWPLALAYTGFFLNLFNLIPLRPLDGGRIAQAFSRRAWILGILLLGAMAIYTRAPQLILIGVLALFAMGRKAKPTDLTPLSAAGQRAWAFNYFGLCLFLGGAMYFAKQLLDATA